MQAAMQDTANPTNPSPTADRELVITRVISAPRELVFKAWTSREHVDHWMGPRGFTTKTSSMEVRPGGAWRFVMSHAEYGEFQNRVTYREITPPERIVYTHDSGVDNDPSAFEVTVTFTAQGDKTRLTMHSVFPSAAELERVKGFGAVESGHQTLERLEEHLTKV
jgi:uncharacterized protein YndB with AHSA1/START domain